MYQTEQWQHQFLVLKGLFSLKKQFDFQVEILELLDLEEIESHFVKV